MLEILRTRGLEFEAIDYINNPPTAEQLERVIDLIPDSPSALVRHDKHFRALNLSADSYQTKDAVANLLAQNPKLMQRPIVVRGNTAIIARPSELVEQLL